MSQFSLLKNSMRSYARCLPYGAKPVEKTIKVNGMKLCGAKLLGAQYGACTIMFKAGSRYEYDETYGASHFLRAVSNCSGTNYTGYMKTNYLHHYGGYITCKSDRQHICYTLQCPPALFTRFRHYLLDVTNNTYPDWEIDDRRAVILDDLSRVTPEERVIDLIQKASFSGPLSNSVFCEEHQIPAMSCDSLGKFKRMYFGASECTVASVGMPFEETILLAEAIETGAYRYIKVALYYYYIIYNAQDPLDRYEICSTYRCGYETYCLGPSDCTWLAIAVPGTGSSALKCLVCHAILAAACGTAPFQTGYHLEQLMEGPLGAMSDLYTTYKAFNISYLDVGLFGILISTPSKNAKEAVFKALDFLTNRISTLTCCQIEMGRQRLKLDVNIFKQNCVNYAEGLALELASSDSVEGWLDMNCLIDSVRPDDVMAVAQGIPCRVPILSYAAVGDLAYAPIDRDLR